ncbi:DUF4235 domain-containing protein [Nocardioides daejeonensis]|uniref:DUF4235 domain-containing protein n=1 Tax=Nocardioides daejeonensis TaxID=1046556 RepID=UPI000D740855|nr:DUF4235 domain-containing protein [Nocardioides daejeonensis]
MAKKSGAAESSSKIWSVMALGTTVASTVLAKKSMNATWKAATGRKPPENPADPDVSLREAVAWAAFSGTFVSVVKMLASRKAAHYYQASTGELPPGLRADGQ